MHKVGGPVPARPVRWLRPWSQVLNKLCIKPLCCIFCCNFQMKHLTVIAKVKKIVQ